MWNEKTKVIQIIIGATGTISKTIQKIPEQHNWESTKSRNCRDTAHILQKVLMSKYKTFSM
jgi:hypothetical protein